MKSILHHIFCSIIANIAMHNNKIVFTIFLLCSYSYGQNSTADSLVITLDSINSTNFKETKIYVGNNTKVYVTKGTVTKNFESNIEQEKLVYLDPKPKKKLTIESVMQLAETKPEPQLKNHKVKLDQLEEKSNKVYYTKNYPFTSLSSINNQKIAATNHHEIFIKASINTQSSYLLETFASYFFKKSYYYYTIVGINYCISNLEIRSPSFFI